MEKLGNIKLYNCDCMELLKQTPDNYYSLALVDPPYGINIETIPAINLNIVVNVFFIFYLSLYLGFEKDYETHEKNSN